MSHEVCAQTYSWGASAPLLWTTVYVLGYWNKEIKKQTLWNLKGRALHWPNNFHYATFNILPSPFIPVLSTWFTHLCCGTWKHRASMVAACIVIMWQNVLSLKAIEEDPFQSHSSTYATWMTHLETKHFITWSQYRRRPYLPCVDKRFECCWGYILLHPVAM